MEEKLTDFAFFVQDFNTKALTKEHMYNLYGIVIEDTTDLISAVKDYIKKYFKDV